MTATPLRVAAVATGSSAQMSTAPAEMAEPVPAEPAPAGVDDGDPGAEEDVVAESPADTDDVFDDDPGAEFGDDFGLDLPQPASSTRLAMTARAGRW